MLIQRWDGTWEDDGQPSSPSTTTTSLRPPSETYRGGDPNLLSSYNWTPPKPSGNSVYDAWLRDNPVPNPQGLNDPRFLAFQSMRGAGGEWLSPQEIYQKRQFEGLKNEEQLNQELQPFILESMGLRYGADGKLEKIPPAPLTPEQQADKALEDLYKEHLSAAMEGRLPVDLGTQKTLERQEEEFNEGMSRKGGRMWREGTPGIRQQGNFMLTSEATKEASRHGDLNTAAGLLNQRQASISDLTQRQLGGLEGMGGPTYSLVNSYGAGQQPYLFQGLLNTRMANQDSANRAADTAGKYGLLATGIGAGAYYGYNAYNQPKTKTARPYMSNPFITNSYRTE